MAVRGVTLQNISLCPARFEVICLSFGVSGHHNIPGKDVETVMNPDQFKHKTKRGNFKKKQVIKCKQHCVSFLQGKDQMSLNFT